MNLIQGVAGYGSWFDKVKVDLSGVIVGQTGSLMVYQGLYIVGLPWVKGGHTGYTIIHVCGITVESILCHIGSICWGQNGSN